MFTSVLREDNILSVISSVSPHTNLGVFFNFFFFHFRCAVLHHLGALERRNLLEVAKFLYSKKFPNGLTLAVMRDGGGE